MLFYLCYSLSVPAIRIDTIISLGGLTTNAIRQGVISATLSKQSVPTFYTLEHPVICKNNVVFQIFLQIAIHIKNLILQGRIL